MKKCILAIETTMDACSVAILSGKDVIEATQIAPRQHTKLILPMVQDLLHQAQLPLTQLDAIAVGCGPGSFTGVRIAISVAQGLAFGAGLSVIPISTLETLALGAFQKAAPKQTALVCVAVDARMNAIYWGSYQISIDLSLLVVEPECVCLSKQISLLTHPANDIIYIAAGSGWEAHQLSFTPNFLFPQIQPNAVCVATLAMKKLLAGEGFVPPEAIQPVYLRNPQLMKVKESVP